MVTLESWLDAIVDPMRIALAPFGIDVQKGEKLSETLGHIPMGSFGIGLGITDVEERVNGRSDISLYVGVVMNVGGIVNKAPNVVCMEMTREVSVWIRQLAISLRDSGGIGFPGDVQMAYSGIDATNEGFVWGEMVMEFGNIQLDASDGLDLATSRIGAILSRATGATADPVPTPGGSAIRRVSVEIETPDADGGVITE